MGTAAAYVCGAKRLCPQKVAPVKQTAANGLARVPALRLAVMDFSPFSRARNRHDLASSALPAALDLVGSVGSKVGRTIKVVLVVGGLLTVAAVTFVAVAAWEIMTSSEVRMVAGAARDRAHATALEASTAAKCDRLIAEARAKNQFLPACASQQRPSTPTSGELAGALLKAAID